MLNKITSGDFLKSKTAAGIEVVFLPEGGTCFNLTLLKKNKSKVEVEKVHTGIERPEELVSLIHPDTPLLLVFTGKGILYKKLPQTSKDNESALLNKIFPGAKPEEFYMEVYPTVENQNFVSVVRKNSVDQWLSYFSNQKRFVVDAFFGPFIFSTLIPFLKTRGETGVSGFSLSVNEEQVIDARPAEVILKEEKTDVAGEFIPRQALLAFAAAFHYFMPSYPATAEIAETVRQSSEHRQKILFKKAGISVLALFFAVLMINFLLFDHFDKRYQRLDSMLYANADILQEVSHLKQELKEKEAFAEKTGLKQASRTSFYADRLSAGLPETIRLNELFINPVAKKIKTGEPIEYQLKTISIKGTTKKSTDLNDWIKNMKDYSWVKGVSVLGYKQNKSSEPGEFEIKISVDK